MCNVKRTMCLPSRSMPDFNFNKQNTALYCQEKANSLITSLSIKGFNIINELICDGICVQEVY